MWRNLPGKNTSPLVPNYNLNRFKSNRYPTTILSGSVTSFSEIYGCRQFSPLMLSRNLLGSSNPNMHLTLTFTGFSGVKRSFQLISLLSTRRLKPRMLYQVSWVLYFAPQMLCLVHNRPLYGLKLI